MKIKNRDVDIEDLKENGEILRKRFLEAKDESEMVKMVKEKAERAHRAEVVGYVEKIKRLEGQIRGLEKDNDKKSSEITSKIIFTTPIFTPFPKL